MISGSYDQSMAVWDLRKLKQPIETVELGASVWDIKFNSDRRIGIASIYDGYRFGPSHNASTTILPETYLEFRGHDSICYAFEWTGLKTTGGKEVILTSSFYDSTLKLI
jgi:WD40 repeat protein